MQFLQVKQRGSGEVCKSRLGQVQSSEMISVLTGRISSLQLFAIYFLFFSWTKITAVAAVHLFGALWLRRQHRLAILVLQTSATARAIFRGAYFSGVIHFLYSHYGRQRLLPARLRESDLCHRLGPPNDLE